VIRELWIGRARAAALLGCLAAALLSPGCAIFHHRQHNDVGCRRPDFNAPTQTLPPLKAPPGLNTPDTSAGVRIPALDAPAPARSRAAPCLDWPPKYAPEAPTPPVRRLAQPTG
jgi:hypothetical protein